MRNLLTKKESNEDITVSDKEGTYYDIEMQSKINKHNEALNVSITYGILGVLWILLSDKFLSFLTKDLVIYKQLQTYKGWFYVLITMILAYILIQKRMKLMIDATNKAIESYIELRATHEELIRIENELEYQKQFTQSIIDDSPVIIGVWDMEGKIKSLNPFGQKTLGYKEDEVIDKKWIDLIVSEENKTMMRMIFEEIQQNKQLENYDNQFITKDGSRIDILWNSSMLKSINNKNDQAVSVGIDITTMKRYQEKVKQMAFYDALTGLPNRVMFEDQVRKLTNNNVEKTKFALVYIDIDNFKYINDTLGHQVGDKFLKYIGECFKDNVKSPNIVARLGGDEFGILFNKIQSDESVLKKLEKIKDKINRKWTFNNHQFSISMSKGIVIYPEHGKDVVSLLKNADIAMYDAKRQGKDKTLFYKENLQEKSSRNIKMANKLQSAIENEEFILFYQPQFKLKTGEIIGTEALIRWDHPKEGFISPVEFIPVAEETGQIYKIEQEIIRKALEKKKKWEEDGINNLELSINLSTKTLLSDSNFQELERLLSTFDVDYSKISIEITETAIISNVDLAIERLKILKKRGLKIALDDFGTGYSSLTYLKELPIDTVKLDKSFVNAIPDDDINTMIVKNVLSMAHDLQFHVIAEGIETMEQLEYLNEYYCKTGQGFLLSKPLSEEKINEFIKSSFKFNT